MGTVVPFLLTTGYHIPDDLVKSYLYNGVRGKKEINGIARLLAAVKLSRYRPGQALGVPRV
jgi:hypothetical protein